MLEKNKSERDQLEFVCLETMVPEDHLLRKIEAAVDFNKIYEFVSDLYCPDNGRPSVDPVVLFKMTLIQHLYGIPSLRRTAEEVQYNICYRWFVGYLLNENTPHFSTLSYNFKNRYTPEIVEKIFNWILDEINNAGYLSPETVFIDGTHIKANANIKKAVKKEIPKAAKRYEEQLLKEINEDREEHGKKPFDGPKPPEKKIVNESTTDPESGVFHKGEHKKCFAYEAETACDKNGYVVDVTVEPGNVHDSTTFDELYDRITEKHPEVKNVVMDAGYKTPWICKRVFDDGRTAVLPYKRPAGKEGFYRPYSYVYDEYYDCIICPEGKILYYSTTNREGYKEFKSKSYQCEGCSSIDKCTHSQKHEKTVTKHIWEKYIERAEDIRHTPKYKAMYDQRKETIERVFADAKEKHAMRYTNHRGLSQVTNWVRLKFAAMNLKKYAVHKWKENCFSFFFAFLHPISA